MKGNDLYIEAAVSLGNCWIELRVNAAHPAGLDAFPGFGYPRAKGHLLAIGNRMAAGLHENLKREQDVKVGSNRAFGLVMAVACLIIACLGLWFDTSYWRYWAITALLFAGFAWLWPGALAPLNRIWFLFGLALHKVVNPLIMGLLFFIVITPIALLMRLFGKRPLSHGFQRDAASYWQGRDENAAQPGPMTKQY